MGLTKKQKMQLTEAIGIMDKWTYEKRHPFYERLLFLITMFDGAFLRKKINFTCSVIKQVKQEVK